MVFQRFNRNRNASYIPAVMKERKESKGQMYNYAQLPPRIISALGELNLKLILVTFYKNRMKRDTVFQNLD
jgi:hypothetical protein